MWAVSHQPRDHHGQSRGGAWWGLDLLPIFNASVRFSFQKAPDCGWLCKPSIFSKYSCETAQDNNLQCKVRGFHKNSRVSRFGSAGLCADFAERNHPARSRGAKWGWSWSLSFLCNKPPLCLKDQNLKSFHGL